MPVKHVVSFFDVAHKLRVASSLRRPERGISTHGKGMDEARACASGFFHMQHSVSTNLRNCQSAGKKFVGVPILLDYTDHVSDERWITPRDVTLWLLAHLPAAADQELITRTPAGADMQSGRLHSQKPAALAPAEWVAPHRAQTRTAGGSAGLHPAWLPAVGERILMLRTRRSTGCVMWQWHCAQSTPALGVMPVSV